MPYSKQQQRKHISDDVVKRACEERAAAADSPKPFLTDILMRETGAPEKVVLAKLEDCADRGLLHYGISIRTGWWGGD